MPLVSGVDMLVALLDLHSSLFKYYSQQECILTDFPSKRGFEHGLALIKCLTSVVMVIGSLHDEAKKVLLF